MKVWVVTQTSYSETMDDSGVRESVSIDSVFLSKSSAESYVARMRSIYAGSPSYAWWVPSYEMEEFEAQE